MLNLQLQQLICAQPSRMDLLEYKPTSEDLIKIGIYRNHSFELIENTIAPYLDFAGFRAEFVYSDYDDSLSFFKLDTSTDILILWLDLNRYALENMNDFLRARISYLKTIYKKPILMAFLGKENIELETDVFPANQIADNMGDAFWDMRMEPFSGTRISVRGLLEISRQLGLNYIPALAYMSLKAIVVDLDNTLYKGVLGEDGCNNIELTEGHRILQKKLLELKKDGFFLCIVSKNEEEDVLKMFHERTDFPLKRDDFSQLCCSWEAKSIAMPKIAEYLNIGIDSFLFVDDNPGELIEMEKVYPDIKKLLAYTDAGKTAYMIENYPGIKKIKHVYEDSIRNADMAANQYRAAMIQKLSHEDYIRSLDMKLTFNIDIEEQAPRISVLANKTNQFIFNYKRYKETEIIDLMQNKNAVVVSVALSDSLSDSGIIAVCVGEYKNSFVEISEFFISCRALGRGIEDIIVRGAIQVVSDNFGVNTICVRFQNGSRNAPAEKYVDENLDMYINKLGQWQFDYPKGILDIKFRRK